MKAALPNFAAFQMIAAASLTIAAATASMIIAPPAFAAEHGGGEAKEGGGPPPAELSTGLRGQVMKTASIIHDPITGIRLNITQFSYPGVPERAACRTVIRVENDSEHKISMYTLLHTFNRDKEPLGTWMTPSGELPPGQSGERLYSCKIARYMVLDQGSAEGWPNSCKVDGEEFSPCPIQLIMDVNIDPLPVPPKDKKDKESKDEKPVSKH